MKRFIQYILILSLFLLVFQFSRLYFLIYGFKELEANLTTVFALTAYKGFLLDLSSAAYCASPFLLLFFIEFFIKKQLPIQVYKVLVIVELLLIGLITIADPELYKQWGSKFNNQVLVYVSHPLEMAISSGATQWTKTIPMALVLTSVFIGLGYLILRVLKRKFEFSVQYLIVNFLVMALSFVFIRGGISVTTISQSSAVFSDKRFYNAAAINSFWNALYYMVYRVDQIYDSKYYPYPEAVANEEFKKQVEGSDLLPDLTEYIKPNVMIVLLESFTASASQYFSGKNNLTPNLDAIAQSSLCFKACYSSGDRTDKGLVAVLSGYPSQAASSIIVFPDKMTALPGIGKTLSGAGYFNSFFYGGDANFASMKAYMVTHGTQSVIDKSSFKKEELNSKWGAHDENLYKKVLKAHLKIKEPFLSTLLTLSSHEPYEVPMHFEGIEKGEWQPFKNSILYADYCLMEFLEACKKQEWYKNTLIVLVADHGHDIGLEGLPFFAKEKYHIPLIVTGGALKEGLKGKVIQNLVSQTVIPKLILNSFVPEVTGFDWQAGVGEDAFVQYHYNSGFGRLDSLSYCLYNNNENTFYFEGPVNDSSRIKREGKIFQQYLIQDFMKK